MQEVDSEASQTLKIELFAKVGKAYSFNGFCRKLHHICLTGF